MKIHLHIFILLLLILTSLFSAQARSDESSGVFENIGKKTSVFYYTQWLGQSISFPGYGRAYSVYTNGLAPHNLYQSLIVKYEVVPNFKIGISNAVFKNLIDNVETPWGGKFNTEWNVYQPRVFVETKSELQFININHQLFIDLPTHENSRKQEHWTAFQLSESLRINNLPNGFSGGMNASWTWHYYGNPQGWITHYFTTGHTLNYKINPHWELGTYSFFDLAYIHPYDFSTPKGRLANFWQLGTAKEHLRVLVNYRHWSDGILRLAPFIQMNIFYPNFENSVLGLELEWTFDSDTTSRFK